MVYLKGSGIVCAGAFSFGGWNSCMDGL